MLGFEPRPASLHTACFSPLCYAAWNCITVRADTGTAFPGGPTLVSMGHENELIYSSQDVGVSTVIILIVLVRKVRPERLNDLSEVTQPERAELCASKVMLITPSPLSPTATKIPKARLCRWGQEGD